MIKIAKNNRVLDDHSFIKRYSIGVAIGTAFFVLLSWIYADLSLNFFKGWKVIAIVALSFAFSLCVIPAILVDLQKYKGDRNYNFRKHLLIGISICVIFLAFNLCIDYFCHSKIDWYFYLVNIIVFLIISIS